MSVQLHREKLFTLFLAVITALLIYFVFSNSPVHGRNILDAFNQRRVSNGLNPLILDPHLQYWAEKEAATGVGGHSYSFKRNPQIKGRWAGTGVYERNDPYGLNCQFCNAVRTGVTHAGVASYVFRDSRGKIKTKYSLFER